jgi:hypothetical protein
MRKRLIVAALAATALVVVAGSALAAAGQSAVIFDSTAKTGPKSNLPSYGAEAYSFAQIGGEVELAGSKRKLTNAVVTLSSWACVEGAWNSGCVTPAGAKYSLPITLNIFDGDQLLTSKTQTFDVSYRPSANPAKCAADAPTKWYSTTEKQCFNGLAQNVTFTFDGTTTLPGKVRYGITYGTSHYGSSPIGARACTSTSAGCFYDSLNVAVTDAVPGVGVGEGTKKLDANGGVGADLSTSLTPAVQFKAGS